SRRSDPRARLTAPTARGARCQNSRTAASVNAWSRTGRPPFARALAPRQGSGAQDHSIRRMPGDGDAEELAERAQPEPAGVQADHENREPRRPGETGQDARTPDEGHVTQREL